MKELLISKIKNIQIVAPTIDDFLNRDFDMDYAKEISKDFTICLKDSIQEGPNKSLTELFNQNVKFIGFTFFGFYFCEFEEYEDFIQIGNRDSDIIIIIKQTDEIALLNTETNEIISFLAKNFVELLDIIPILISYDKIGILGETYTDEIKKQTLANLKKSLEKKYFKFYEFTLC